MNDDQCVKVSMAVPKVSEETAAKKIQEVRASCISPRMHDMQFGFKLAGFPAAGTWFNELKQRCFGLRLFFGSHSSSASRRPPSTSPSSALPPRSTKCFGLSETPERCSGEEVLGFHEWSAVAGSSFVNLMRCVVVQSDMAA
jgi:hypothetical protein